MVFTRQEDGCGECRGPGEGVGPELGDDAPLGFAGADVVEDEGAVGAEGGEDGGLGSVEADGGDGFGGG